MQRRLNGGRSALSESGDTAEAGEATPDGASNGVPVFVMLPLDSVGCPASCRSLLDDELEHRTAEL